MTCLYTECANGDIDVVGADENIDVEGVVEVTSGRNRSLYAGVMVGEPGSDEDSESEVTVLRNQAAVSGIFQSWKERWT